MACSTRRSELCLGPDLPAILKRRFVTLGVSTKRCRGLFDVPELGVFVLPGLEILQCLMSIRGQRGFLRG